MFVGDAFSYLHRGVTKLGSRYHLQDTAKRMKFGRGCGCRCVDHGAHLVLRDQACQVSCRAKCSAVNLGQAKERVIARDDDVAIADKSDAATDTESGNGSDHGNGAVVHGGKGGVATLVRAD